MSTPWDATTTWSVQGAEAQDKLVSGWSGVAGLNLIPGTGWTIETASPKHGAAHMRCVVNGSQGAMYSGSGMYAIGGGILARAWVYEGWFKLGAGQSGAFPLLSGQHATGPTMKWALEVGYGNGNTGKLRFTTGPWATRTALTGWTASALNTSDWKHVFFVLDNYTLGEANTWASVVIDGVEEIAQVVGNWNTIIGYVPGTTTDIRWLAPFANAGCSVDLDDVSSVYSDTVFPHVSQVPQAVEYWQRPISQVAGDWLDQAGNPASYTQWDDLGNDGDTTYNYTNTTNKNQLSAMQTRAQVGMGVNDIILQGYQSGAPQPPYACRWVTIAKYTTGTKFSGYTDILLGSQNFVQVTSGPLTSYGVKDAYLYRPPSGAALWTPVDLDTMQAGAVTGGTNHDEDWRITMLGCQWAAYADLNPLTSTPTLPPAGGATWARAQLL